ncbi:hypothetical protein EHW67_06790 [Arenibacter aquaticus]|uniref:Uncharacterized protein n=1 Tax=Arenibacter aquaticus TaxID=2489054 RepID=A0A430K737_9FLAO|nr:hypothetical protein [Arenibacter aquaticus]RTE54863.1 hypothetical protein EHW67_06790 [Arenibacter aquaticus]
MFIDFSLKGHREFPQLNFDWDRTELIMDYGECELISLAHNTVNLRYKKNLNDLNNNNTLKIKTSKGKLYYFRYEYKLVKDGIIQLRGGVWLTQQPKNLRQTTISVSEIHLPIMQNGDINICFIGFSDNKWGGFRSIRKYMKQKNHDINFIGPKQDIYGYPYMPVPVNKGIEFLVKNINNIPNADIYIIFIESLKTSKNRQVWSQLADGLSKKGQKTYLNTWPELKENPKNEEIRKMNKLLQEIATCHKNIKIMELNGFNDAGATILDNGQYFLNNSGYKLYKKIILEQIEDKKE